MKRMSFLVAIAGVLSLVACATTPRSAMQMPMQAENEPEFIEYMDTLEARLGPRQVIAVKDAISVLFIGDRESANRNEFFRVHIDGRTPAELIAAAEPVRKRYDIKKPQALNDEG